MASPKHQDAEKENWSFQNFSGVNTQAVRQSIKDDEFAWLENAMPIGFGNLKVVPYQSGVLATLPATCYSMQAANIANVDYMFMFCTNGSAYQVNLSNFALTLFAAAGTFNGSGTNIAQWKNERILIIDPVHGYFSWDGGTLTVINGTVQSVAVTYSGSGYTARPTVNFGGPGSGANGQAVMGAVGSILAAGGTGYFVGDVLKLTGGAGAAIATMTVTSVGASNVITGFTISAPGDYTSIPANPVASTGGLGTGATFTVTWGIASVTILAGGTGYSSAPAVTFSAGNATATANTSVAPSAGNYIASYGGRVWVAAGRTVVFSAPNSYTDFSSPNAGGSFIFTDETLHSNINQLVYANNFLYIVGDSSFNVISDVRVSNGITIFSNTNVSASVGSNFGASVVPYYRSLWFANLYGVYALYGSTTQKASDALDGLFPVLNLAGGISGGQFVLNNVLCVGFLAQYVDPVQGQRGLLMVYAGKKWFFCSQGNALKFVAGSVPLGTPTLYGTDGTRLYRMFFDTTTNIAVTFKSKLWDVGDPLRVKQVFKVGLESTYLSATGNISISLDTEYGTQTTTSAFGLAVNWSNNFGAIIPWSNNSLAIVGWIANQTGYYFTKYDLSAFGNYMGITVNSTVPQGSYSAVHFQYERRAVWATPGT